MHVAHTHLSSAHITPSAGSVDVLPSLESSLAMSSIEELLFHAVEATRERSQGLVASEVQTQSASFEAALQRKEEARRAAEEAARQADGSLRLGHVFDQVAKVAGLVAATVAGAATGGGTLVAAVVVAGGLLSELSTPVTELLVEEGFIPESDAPTFTAGLRLTGALMMGGPHGVIAAATCGGAALVVEATPKIAEGAAELGVPEWLTASFGLALGVAARAVTAHAPNSDGPLSSVQVALKEIERGARGVSVAGQAAWHVTNIFAAASARDEKLESIEAERAGREVELATQRQDDAVSRFRNEHHHVNRMLDIANQIAVNGERAMSEVIGRIGGKQ